MESQEQGILIDLLIRHRDTIISGSSVGLRLVAHPKTMRFLKSHKDQDINNIVANMLSTKDPFVANDFDVDNAISLLKDATELLKVGRKSGVRIVATPKSCHTMGFSLENYLLAEFVLPSTEYDRAGAFGYPLTRPRNRLYTRLSDHLRGKASHAQV
ncbi:hypothetical protein QN372_19715 [Undibacterium sp. RTI2.1]|uniref:hypothetical protein n=1 Tax=unclassified Undibacterium TaxID=2630295 RepID=UPI002B238A32|nr:MULTISPECIES: hypothetical protein [unclassified Undibacterium]MEB0032980.1 hypothetical protein [Undibacterium sp. RTI2.1]MEB0118847.1 hypothetical protein [Undibacterium sp. RTI2.2]